MATLVRRKVLHPEALTEREVAAEPEAAADLALVRGDRVLARSRYLARLAADHTDLDAWVGLGLADDACRVLVERPELVYAVASLLTENNRRPDPAALAAWMDAAAPL